MHEVKEITYIAEDYLGEYGANVKFKTKYRHLVPDNLIVLNAKVCTDTEIIWKGDLDITEHTEDLIELSDEIEKPIHVFKPTELEDFNKIQVDKAVCTITNEGVTLRPTNKGFSLVDGVPLKYHELTYDEDEWQYKMRYEFINKFDSLSPRRDPYDLFFYWIAEELGGLPENHIIDVSQVWVTYDDHIRLMSFYENWLVNFKHHTYFEAHHEVKWLDMDKGPGVFQKEDTPEWAKDGYVYVREPVLIDMSHK